MATEAKMDEGKLKPADLETAYRTTSESKRQWELRRKFIEKYWHQYDEDRLLCLAQCYVNMRCMGCKYSKSVDSLVEELAKEIE